jgi:hypothetical protein
LKRFIFSMLCFSQFNLGPYMKPFVSFRPKRWPDLRYGLGEIDKKHSVGNGEKFISEPF